MEDIRKVYHAAGTGNKGQTFIFTDNEIKEEAFLEYINNILSVGEIAGLFPADEMDDIRTTVTPMMKRDDPKRPPTPDNLYDYFLTRAKDNLHMVLCFSPVNITYYYFFNQRLQKTNIYIIHYIYICELQVGEKFRTRSLKFPGLISGCTLNWFWKWPIDALYAVSDHFLEGYKIIATPETKQQLVEVMGDMHNYINDMCVQYFDRYKLIITLPVIIILLIF